MFRHIDNCIRHIYHFNSSLLKRLIIMERKKKSSKKFGAPKIIDLDAQQRKLAIMKQKQCDTIALHIVNKLIDASVEEDVFIQSLKYLNQCHYQDISEERAITKICGYPVCRNTISDMPSKKYHISTKSNKVYDISERKNYCSNFCYKASIHIKNQMLTSPLWFRDKEEIPTFHLLPTIERGVPGEEVDQGLTKVDLKQDDIFTSVQDCTQDMISDIPKKMYNKLNIDCESKDNINETQEPQEKDEYFSYLYGPSLADILRENAEYFDKNKPDKQIDRVSNKNNPNSIREKAKLVLNNIIENTENNNTTLTQKEISKKEINNIKSNDMTVKINTGNEKLLSHINKKEIKKQEQNANDNKNIKIGFDRTLINTGHNEEVKSILSKNKSFNTLNKKRVSFHSEDSVKEIEKIADIHRSYDNQEKVEKKEEKIYKNTNVIGTVQEKSNVYKYQTVKLNNATIKETEINSTNMTTTKDNEIQKSIKDARRNRIKSSSAYANANKFSKPSVIVKAENYIDINKKFYKYMEEWFTLDTFIFLHGEELAKTFLSEEEFNQYISKKRNISLDVQKQKKYSEICKRITSMELSDRKFDESVTGKKLRSLPRFEDLKEEAEAMDLRVKAFYSGYEMLEGDCDSDTESVGQEDGEENTSIAMGAPAVLPLIDSKDVIATRRRIFLSSISRSISCASELLQLYPNSLLADIKNLVDTLNLTAKNIVFKTAECPVIVLLVLKILSIRDEFIDTAFHKKDAEVHIISLGHKLYQQGDAIIKILDKSNIESLLHRCIRNRKLE